MEARRGKTSSAITIRYFEPARDLPNVLAIERESYLYPRMRQEFEDWHKGSHAIGYVATLDRVVVGFVTTEFMQSCIHMASIAVAAKKRRLGVGRALCEHLKDRLDDKRKRIVTEVAESNLDGCRFLRALGFRAQLPILKDWFDDTPEEAFRFVWKLNHCGGK